MASRGSRSWLRTIVAGVATVSFAGCLPGPPPSALDPAGPFAAHINWLWWLLLVVCTTIWVIVIAVLALAILRHHDAPDRQEIPDAAHRRVLRVVTGAVGITALILLGFLAATFVTERRMTTLEREAAALEISVIGRQWWWQVRYEAGEPHKIVTTANEIHVPVGRPVRLRLSSADVIHSFWIPSLNGKRDLVPGRENTLWLQADRPGVFEGQCAEFCGHQHAHMRVLVVAQPPQDFEAWLAQQRAPAREPQSGAETRGRDVFLGATCIMCHTVRGTTAMSNAGPDLTHVASRRMLAAGAIPNNRGYLAGWILDPQGIKPGNHMPPHQFPADDFQSLLDYLESLQ